MPTRSTQHGPHTSSVVLMLTDSVATNPVRTRAVGRLEPCAGKLACTVLRGGRAGNGVPLPDGKAGVQVELGLKTVIMEDQFQFILHHRVMQHEVDEQVTLPMVVQTKQRFPDFVACSFDKGFHSPSNQSELKQHLELVALPRKGQLSQAARVIEASPEFVQARRKHSAVESAINALEVHGLDMCPDHGINGFKRYVALAVVARNIHRIGAILKQQEQKREQRKKKYADRDTTYKLAA